MKNLQVLVTFGYVLTTFCNCCKIYAHFNFGLGLPGAADALSVAVAAFFSSSSCCSPDQNADINFHIVDCSRRATRQSVSVEKGQTEALDPVGGVAKEGGGWGVNECV